MSPWERVIFRKCGKGGKGMKGKKERGKERREDRGEKEKKGKCTGRGKGKNRKWVLKQHYPMTF